MIIILVLTSQSFCSMLLFLKYKDAAYHSLFNKVLVYFIDEMVCFSSSKNIRFFTKPIGSVVVVVESSRRKLLRIVVLVFKQKDSPILYVV
jgi:hypothetical protein